MKQYGLLKTPRPIMKPSTSGYFSYNSRAWALSLISPLMMSLVFGLILLRSLIISGINP